MDGDDDDGVVQRVRTWNEKRKMMNNNTGTFKRNMYVCIHLSSVTFDTGNVCRANFRTISGENVPSLIPEEETLKLQFTMI